MTAPTLQCAKGPTPASGQEQTYLFYYLVAAVDANGNPTQIRQQVAQNTAAQLATIISQAQAKQALIAALPA